MLELSASVEGEEPDVYGAVNLMNYGAAPLPLRYASSCGLALLIFDPAGAPEHPRWDSSRWLAEQGGECPAPPLDLEIPDETLARILLPVVDTGYILGDSLPPGRYRAAVRFRLLTPNDTTFVLNAGPLELGR
jgi:hypothetical protein